MGVKLGLSQCGKNMDGEGVWEQGAEENISTWEGWSKRRMEKTS
jgi:hypothetical protein